jgi:thiamine biosynthesis lipoprotein
MGVRVRLVVYAPSEEAAKAACRAAFARVAELEQVASDYRPSSELMRLCAHFDAPNAAPVRVSADLWNLLLRSRRVSEASRGAFDVSVGPLVKSWRAARQAQVLPPRASLKAARRLVNWKKIELHAASRSVRLRTPGMRLDLGGIAKGFAGDAALQVLASRGVRRALFEAGGDIIAGAPPPGQDGWKVRWPEGFDVSLRRGALSTSGDTAQWVEIGGRRYSHVVDPRTGLGLSNRWMATVFAPDGATADALSTAATVTGPRGVERLHGYFPGAKVWVRRAPERART